MSTPFSATPHPAFLEKPPQSELKEALAAARDTRVLETGEGALARLAPVFAKLFPGKKAVVVADTASFAAGGKEVQDRLKAAGLAARKPFVFRTAPLPAESGFVTRVQRMLQVCNAVPVAVGSGTINDLVKLAAHRTGRPYLCVATAASMDGYTAFGASITFRGAKQTFQCPAPLGVFADSRVLASAPPQMTAAGYADLLAKVTAGADWLLADALGLEALDTRAWKLAQGGLDKALRDPEGARRGEPRAVSALAEGLLLGGFAMQTLQSSRPASGAEHQFSHLWDMEHHTHGGAAPSHGFKVGVATLAVTALYERLLARDLGSLEIEVLVQAWPEADTLARDVELRFAGSGFLDTALAESRAKHPSRDELRRELTLLRSLWPRLVQRLKHQLLPFDEAKARLAAVGAPVEPEEIGIGRARLRDSFRRALHLRRRFTVLDLAFRAGVLDSCLSELFGRGCRWDIGVSR